MTLRDVVVVGAGPAGAAAATHLARSGLKVTLVDRAHFPREKTCGDALSNLALQELQGLGVGEQLSQASTPVKAALAVFPGGYSVRRDYGAEPGSIAPRLSLDQLILERALAAGAELLEGVQVTEIRRADSGQGTELSLSCTSRGKAQPPALTARAVIAADGPASVAWKALGVQRAAASGLAVAATAYYRGVTPRAAATSEHHFSKSLPCGYFWVFPEVDGAANVGVYQRLDFFQAGNARLAGLLSEFVAQEADCFGAAEQVSPLKSWQLPISEWQLPPAGPGILCTGDAARSVDALTGEGIYQALYSGRLAAETTLAGLQASGHVSGDRARRYQRRLARRIHFPQAARRAIQRALVGIVDHELESHRVMQRLLELGYGGGALEVTKRVRG